MTGAGRLKTARKRPAYDRPSMLRRPQQEPWLPARDVPFLVFLAAVAASMVRTVDQPDVALSLAGTEITVVPTDLVLVALGSLCLLRFLGRGALPQPARAITATAALFFGWLLVTSAAHGADAFVGAAKLLEYGVLGLGAVLFVRRRRQVWLLATVLVAVTVVGVVDVAIDFARDPGVRHGGFLGAHDFAALATMCLTLGLAGLYATGQARKRFSILAGTVGALGLIFPAPFASLLGLYLAAAALVGVAWRRGQVTRSAVAITAATLLVVTAGVFGLRTGDAGFVKEVTGSTDEANPAANASGWSQRLIYAYVGGRVFLDNPIVGTGWYGELPPSEYARYLDDARARFPDQPPGYFPQPDATFIPQQTYDQVLFELGLVGAVLFLALAVAVGRTAWRVARDWPVDGADAQLAYLPVAWAASLAGALAGAALFGGIPLAAVFWLTLGVVALMPSLAPAPSAPAWRAEQREPALVAG